MYLPSSFRQPICRVAGQAPLLPDATVNVLIKASSRPVHGLRNHMNFVCIAENVNIHPAYPRSSFILDTGYSCYAPETMETSDLTAQAEGTGDVDFHHPYSPYDVQLQFMKQAYEVLEKGSGQIGILESPTGTGKSLSIICASMTWLRDFKKKEFGSALRIDPKEAEDEPDWIIEQMLQRKRKELVQEWEAREARLETIRQKEKRMEERGKKRRRLEGPRAASQRKEDDEDAEFLLGDWNDAGDTNNSDTLDPLSGLSKETRALLQQVGMGTTEIVEPEDANANDEIKVGCARSKKISLHLTNICRYIIRRVLIRNSPNSYQN